MDKRKDIERPSWDEIFMFSAYAAATRASCFYLMAGAAIEKDKRIIASGYNGAPPGIENCLKRGCRKDEYDIDFDDKGKSVCRGAHAEINAMNQIARDNLKSATLYSVYLPCSSCAKVIAGNELSEVVYSKIYSEPDSLTKEIFSEAKIKLRKLEIDFDKFFKLIMNIKKQRG